MASPRIIAITGASAGIGRAAAVRLARDGASLAICARRGDRLRQVAAEIEAAGGHALPFVGRRHQRATTWTSSSGSAWIAISASTS